MTAGKDEVDVVVALTPGRKPEIRDHHVTSPRDSSKAFEQLSNQLNFLFTLVRSVFRLVAQFLYVHRRASGANIEGGLNLKVDDCKLVHLQEN